MEEDEDVVSSRAIVSSFLPELTIRKEEYDDLWKYKDESSNPRQHGYLDIIENEQMTAMENELRKIVDEMMRSELQLLQVNVEISSPLGLLTYKLTCSRKLTIRTAAIKAKGKRRPKLNGVARKERRKRRRI